MRTMLSRQSLPRGLAVPRLLRSPLRQWQRQFTLQSTPPRPKHAYLISHSLRSPRRWASTINYASAAGTDTATKAAVGTANAGSRFIAYAYGTGLVLFLGAIYLYVTDTRASIHQYVVVPLLRRIHTDAEDAHHKGVRYIKGLYDFNLHVRERGNVDKELGDLQVEVFGHILDNPIGTSAGIDKNAEIPSALFALGPAVVEVGGATPLPQQGNPKPRVFRIPSQNALINRYGLNSEGAEHVAMQLRERLRHYAYENGLGLEAESERSILDGEAGVPPGSLVPGKLLAVQIAKNKDTTDGDIEAVVSDYVFCVEHLAKYADILVVNVSSPNTPGLRGLQATKPLTAILSAVVGAAKSIDRKTKPAVMVKVSPDEDTDTQVEGICEAVWASGVDGVIVGNTTKKRPDPVPKGYIMPANDVKTLSEIGGYSGPQMFERTLNLVKRYRNKLDEPLKHEVPESVSPQSQKPSTSEPLERLVQPTDDEHKSDESVRRDQKRLKPLTAEAEKESKQPHILFPDRHTGFDSEKVASVGGAADTAPVNPPHSPPVTEGKASSPREAAEGALHKIITAPQSASESALDNPVSAPSSSSTAASGAVGSSPAEKQEKVIFATGGITNGEQCLQILNAGASVCQVYTAMMYGGVGTITRMKSEMREAIKKGGSNHRE